MHKRGNDITPEEEEKIIKLLSSLRVEPAPEADFEGRFLAEFKNRMARDSVIKPARALLWEHIRQFIDNVGGVRRWAMVSTSLVAVLLVAVGLVNIQSEGVPKAVASVNSSVAEHPVPMLGRKCDYSAAVVAEITCESLRPEQKDEKEEEQGKQPEPVVQPAE
jgi:hypothetical protein